MVEMIKKFLIEEKGNKLSDYSSSGLLNMLLNYTQSSLNQISVTTIGLDIEDVK
jgi:hypothetical protein